MRIRPVPQPDGLIGVLVDPSASEAERDDAATDLAKYDEPKAEEALIQVASKSEISEMLADTCGESLGTIWARQGRFNRQMLDKLHPVARKMALRVIETQRPDLITPV